jgi:glycerophosphoryl diester phosphodiesterase
MAAKIKAKTSSRNFYFVAHRGASFDAPENTLAAINLAWRQRADAVEIDVHPSKDGKLVVIHDHNTRRTAGVNRKISSQTLAELRALDAGRWKGMEWLDEKIPTLEEVLASVPPGRRLFIEIKSRTNIAPALAKVLARSTCRPAQIILIGFSLTGMTSLKRKFPQMEICWLTILRRHWRTRRWPDTGKLLQKLKAAGLDGLDLKANKAITSSLVKKIHDAGLKLYVWTVDTPAEAKRMAQAGVDGITTNRPGWLRAQLGL